MKSSATRIRAAFVLGWSACQMVPCSTAVAAPPPVPRISDVFNLPVGGMYPYDRYDFRFKVMYPAILETESMIAAASVVKDTSNGFVMHRWSSVSFWGNDDAPPVTRNITSRIPATVGSVAYKSRLFLNCGTSFTVLDRDPTIPQASFAVGGGLLLGDISDRHIVLHTHDAYTYGTDLRFLDTQTLQTVGIVTTRIRSARVAIGQGEIYLASEKKGTVKLHRMSYPDFREEPVVKAKLHGVPGTYTWVDFFSPLHAVVIDKSGREILIRWQDPAKGGKIGIYRSPDPSRHRWFETGGRLGVIGTYPELSLAHVRFNDDGTFEFEPSGAPKGFRNQWIHSIGPESVFIAGPLNTSNFQNTATWCHRIRLAPGSQLHIAPAIATEADHELRFEVSLNPPSATPVTFDYQTVSRSAAEHEDYTPVAGTATLAPGQTSMTIRVPIVSDDAAEMSESLEFQITGLEGAYCDTLRTPGRILGDNLRVVESVTTDNGSMLASLDASSPRWGGVHSLSFPGGNVVARDHGFEQFLPLSGNTGTFYYARAQRLGTDTFVLCQFDPTRAELTWIFETDEPRRIIGDELVIQTGQGYIRYGF